MGCEVGPARPRSPGVVAYRQPLAATRSASPWIVAATWTGCDPGDRGCAPSITGGAGAAIIVATLRGASGVKTGSCAPNGSFGSFGVPPQLLDGFMAVLGGRIGMATGLVRHRTPVDSAPTGIAPDVRLTPSADYMMWSLAGQVGQFPGGDSRAEAETAARSDSLMFRLARRLAR